MPLQPGKARVRAAREYTNRVASGSVQRQKRVEMLAYLVTVEGVEVGEASEMAWRAFPEGEGAQPLAGPPFQRSTRSFGRNHK